MTIATAKTLTRNHAGAHRVVAVSAPDDLARFMSPCIAATIWQRQLDPALADWLATVPARNLPQLREPVATESVHAALARAFSRCQTPAGQSRDRFSSDIAALVRLFAINTGSPFVRLRLDVVTNDACRRFHVDQVPARMLCTYLGPGTQFRVESDDLPPGPTQQMATGAVGMFRGALWSGHEPLRLKHRSPPIQGSGQTRFLAVLDPADTAGCC